MTNKAIPELSVDTSLLVERLRKLAVNEVISWDDLSAVVSRDVRREAHSNLSSARRIAQRDYEIITACVRGEGLKRLDDSGIVSTADHSMSKIHREAKRGISRLSCVSDFDKLDNTTKIKMNAARAGLGVMSEITKTKNVAKLENAVEKSNATLPIAETLKVFMNGGK